MRDRQERLGNIGLVAALPAAVLPWALQRFMLPLYAAADAALPAFTQWWLRFWPLSLLLPLLVGIAWWLLRAHPSRGSVVLGISLLGGMLLDGAAVVAVWLPLLGLPDLA